MLNRNEGKKQVQGDLFKVYLKEIISPKHPMVKLADTIDWKSFEESLSGVFCADNGRPSCSVRLMVGLHYLKYMSNLSDRDVLEEWVQNPYWQCFCGGEFFEQESPIDSSSMTNWRKYLSEKGAEKLLEESIKSGLRTKIIRAKDIEKVNADTTIQEKHVRFPTDARLYDRMREKLVRKAKQLGVILRQSYEKTGKRILRQQSAQTFCDLGYRKHNYEGRCDVQVVARHRKTIPAPLRKYWKRRSAIEPVIGHVKEDYRMNRNRLKGTIGDKINVLMAAAALNMSKMLRAIARLFCILLRNPVFQENTNAIYQIQSCILLKYHKI